MVIFEHIINKGKWISAVILLLVPGLFSGCGKAGNESAGISNERISITEEELDIEGVNKEFSLFFVADSHISLCDDRDAVLKDKAKFRSTLFKHDGIEAWDSLELLFEDTINKDDDLVVMGGDIVDSAMYASIDRVKAQTDKLKRPFIYYMGNHDFEYGTEYFTDKAYSDYLPRFKDLRGDKPFQVKEYEDFTVFAMDDMDCQIGKEALAAYKAVDAKDKPIILALHSPILPVKDQEDLRNKCDKLYGPGSVYKKHLLMGSEGCRPNEVTKEFLKLVLAKDSPVVLVLAGHLHFYHKDMLNSSIPQIITGPAFMGEALRIRIKHGN